MNELKYMYILSHGAMVKSTCSNDNHYQLIVLLIWHQLSDKIYNILLKGHVFDAVFLGTKFPMVSNITNSGF